MYCITKYGKPLASSTAWMVTTAIVRHGGGGLGFTQKALAGHAASGQLRGQHLDGDDAMQRRIEGFEDHAHAASADLLQHLVASQEAKLLRLVRGTEETQGQIPEKAGSSRVTSSLFSLRRSITLRRAGSGADGCSLSLRATPGHDCCPAVNPSTRC